MRKIKYFICFMLVLSLIFAGCAKKGLVDATEITNSASEINDLSLRATMLYYLDDNDYIIPVESRIPWVEGIGKSALSFLVAGGDDEIKLNALGLYPPVPEGVTFDLDIDDGVATVNIMLNGHKIDKKKMKLMIKCISNTLICFESVDKVVIQIDGKQVSATTGIDSEYVKTMANVEPQGSEENMIPEQYANLYFISSSGEFLVPVKRLIGEISPEIIIEELLLPNTDTTLSSSLPPTVEVLSVVVDGYVATVDLSSEFEQLADDPKQERLAMTAIRKTLTEIDGIDAVLISVEGEVYESVVTTMAEGSFYNILD